MKRLQFLFSLEYSVYSTIIKAQFIRHHFHPKCYRKSCVCHSDNAINLPFSLCLPCFFSIRPMRIGCDWNYSLHWLCQVMLMRMMIAMVMNMATVRAEHYAFNLNLNIIEGSEVRVLYLFFPFSPLRGRILPSATFLNHWLSLNVKMHFDCIYAAWCVHYIRNEILWLSIDTYEYRCALGAWVCAHFCIINYLYCVEIFPYKNTSELKMNEK